MIAPSYPEYIDAGLKDIESTFHLRWNPHARVLKPGSYQADGTPIPPQYEPRYEVWGKDADGVDYKVMTVDVHGEFRTPGQWLLDRLNMINPARYGGDISRTMAALIDNPNNKLKEIAERDWQDFVQGVASWYWNAGKIAVTKTKDGF